MKPLKNLNEIHRNGHLGIYKKWIYNSEVKYSLMCDYMQKINYCIQDLNEELKNDKKSSIKDLIYIITLADWVTDSYRSIKEAINDKVIKSFSFSKQEELEMSKKYLDAIRSFVVAHPLKTSRHPYFGFDGDFICVDVRQDDVTFELWKEEKCHHLDFKGIHS